MVQTIIEAGAGAAFLVATLAMASQHHPSTAPMRVSVSLVVTALASAYLLVGAVVRMMPELTEQQVWVLERGPGRLVLQVMAKRHTDCKWRSNDLFVVDAEGRTHPAGRQVADSDADSRPPGWHAFRPRVLKFDPSVQPVAVRFVSHYQCALWTVKDVDSGDLPI